MKVAILAENVNRLLINVLTLWLFFAFVISPRVLSFSATAFGPADPFNTATIAPRQSGGGRFGGVLLINAITDVVIVISRRLCPGRFCRRRRRWCFLRFFCPARKAAALDLIEVLRYR